LLLLVAVLVVVPEEVVLVDLELMLKDTLP
jgi:hypothetical protein